MFLSDEGKYFFDKKMKIEYTFLIHKEVVLHLYGNPNLNIKPSFNYSIIKNNINYNFKKNFNEIIVSFPLTNNNTILRRHPFNLIMEGKNENKDTISCYNREQFENIIKYSNIIYPCFNSMILTDEIKELIFDSENKENLEISNLPLKELYNEKKYENGVFGQLSKYITLYMKNDFNIKDYPESKYFNESDFLIDVKEKMVFFYSENDLRYELMSHLTGIIQKRKIYFFTGPHGTGKTFTLLSFPFYNAIENFHYIYINLDILSRENNYMEILFYEARNLFDTLEEYINSFEYVKNNLKIPELQNYYIAIKNIKEYENGIILTVICLINYIKEIINNKINKGYYAIFIDQFKYKTGTNHTTDLIIQLKNKVEETKLFSLIVCSSLNYSGIKEYLISKLSYSSNNQNKFKFDFMNKLCNKPSFIKNEKYLSLLGYLPRYCQIEHLISQKYINIIKKIAKKKIYKFYDNHNNTSYDTEDLMLIKLKWIKNKKNQSLSADDLINFIKDDPIKYFGIDFNAFSFDYLFPLVGTVIDELIESKELKTSFFGLLNDSQRGWIFEHLLFDTIKKTNLFLDYYIENSILIKTIFKKEKLENFDKKTNTLFYFSISNVKRYDAVIYIAENNSVILIQASIHKSEKKLAEYTEDNLNKDITKINRFFKENDVNPNKYYLVFVLDYINYYGCKDNMDLLKKFHYNYCFYEPNKEELVPENLNLKEISNKQYNIIDEEDNEGFIFIRSEHFKNIKESEIEYKPGYYYAEKGMNLLTFLKEICSEFVGLINYISKDKKYKYYKLNKFVKNYYDVRFSEELFDKGKDRIILALNRTDLILGISEGFNQKNKNIEYKWQKWSEEDFTSFLLKDEGKPIIINNDKIFINNLEEYFIFIK